MHHHNQLTESLVEDTRKVKEEFEDIVATYSADLWNYCKYVTGSPWDGEDLYQETMIKSFGMLPYRWSEITDKKFYLFKMATNTWLDQCRKMKRDIGTLQEAVEPSVDLSDKFMIEEILLSLDSNLTIKQTAAFLLVDIFQFNANEVAGIVQSTPGGVYASVQRARKKIERMDFTDSHTKVEIQGTNPTIQAYLEAFDEGNLESILRLFSEQAENEAALGFQEFSKDEMRKGSLRFGLPGHTAKMVELWGKQVIAVFTDEEHPQLHDIQMHEVENGKIVKHTSYFFRKELLLAAAEELGVSAQLVKPPVNWS